jgi:hypothetical protein
MSDLALFVFGFIAMSFTLGPLTIAAIAELREKDGQK